MRIRIVVRGACIEYNCHMLLPSVKRSSMYVVVVSGAMVTHELSTN
jgi:hypothetical protein